MKDRFKFRAWNLEKGIMHYNAEDTYDGISENGIEHSNFSALLEDNEYIVMQSTGLKDKNGKLIFEGDILKVPTQCNKELHGSYSLQEIVWRNGNWVLSYISSATGHKLPRGWSACFLHDQWSDEYEKEFIFTNADIFCTYNELEIIGNIYENKELLGGK